MRSASFCLVKGQETQLISKQEVKIAANTLLLSTRKLWIVFTLALGQSGVETLKYSGDKQEVRAFVRTGPADKALICPQTFTLPHIMKHLRRIYHNLIMKNSITFRFKSSLFRSVFRVLIWVGEGRWIQQTEKSHQVSHSEQNRCLKAVVRNTFLISSWQV